MLKDGKVQDKEKDLGVAESGGIHRTRVAVIHLQDNMATEDANGVLAAFLDKRKPEWNDR